MVGRRWTRRRRARGVWVLPIRSIYFHRSSMERWIRNGASALSLKILQRRKRGDWGIFR
ncbi:uncharacterized protein LACBIDRAFT_311794 [Laccaria bicolor S238N-H82]|uniref:Predicted protein n=1 Tax=Laccaria bicolor (strain S238N-H82 / ATCC MYA-4686) TaxID=486041 RepID=B0CYB1_LACBS|nr:uncharacterized protein LACBIDRAFT_311794 [Laccaria bicolor S238N-H82]EDR12413.1 predicted protein [Laccaria bicolor S238N-H82]|eukprot:XP_001876677.1 predicted protein [Laccaria bicolor S238N-H82]